VTGASSGIGLATAQLVAARAARVVLFARSAADLESVREGALANAVCVAGDVTRADDVQRLFATVRSQFDGIDGLFANAGTAEFLSLADANVEHYDRVMDTNMKGAFFTLKYA